jgi:iron complex transport system permease protein
MMKKIGTFAVLTVMLIATVLLNIKMGSVEVSWHEIAEVITGHVSDGLVYNIVWELRLPRICAAMLLGGALAVSGFMLQVYFNNPIAGPFVLGISSGAKMAVALVMIIFSGAAVSMTSASLIISAFAGAMISMGMILLISRVIHNMYMLIVGGIMIGYICTAVTDFLVTFADDSNIVNLHNWSVGSFSGITWDNVHVMSVVVIAAVAAVFMMSKQTEAFLLGEDYARSMGVNLKLYKTSVILLSSLLSACVAAYAGPVSFVGIAVPHIVKRMLGTAKPIIVMPACFLCGAVFCLGCDLIARMAFAPVEVNISSVTAVFGAPVVLYVLIKKKR